MATGRELERLVRSLLAAKTDREYVVHYLMETYQLSFPESKAVVEKVSPAGGKFKTQTNRMVTPMPEGGPQRHGDSGGAMKKTTFY